MNTKKAGILGTGYLGNILSEIITPDKLAWLSYYERSEFIKTDALNIHFDWCDKKTWENIPKDEVLLILTIPPVIKNVEAEEKRLSSWCDWMKINRPKIQKLVYISTTGVYPNKNGIWTEDQEIFPDAKKGLCRLSSEKILAKYFKLNIIRSGAIYGPGRNVGVRILLKKSVPQGDQPIHRIHVVDLARLTLKALEDECFPSIINAVDQLASSSKEVAVWLKSQPFFKCEFEIVWKAGDFTRKDLVVQKKRIIDNDKLRNLTGFQLKYPTYQQGLLQSFS